jgi:hypothetical protein
MRKKIFTHGTLAMNIFDLFINRNITNHSEDTNAQLSSTGDVRCQLTL